MGKLSMLWLTGKLLYAAILMKFASEIKGLSKQKNISDWRLFSILKILLNCAMLPPLTASVLCSDLSSFFQKKYNPFLATSILDGS
jgi:integral membrane sensor domain MASE1